MEEKTAILLKSDDMHLVMSLGHRYQHAYELANRYDQEHIFAFWDELTTSQRERLLSQAEGIDYAFLERVFAKKGQQEPDIEGIEPPLIHEKEKTPAIVVKKGERAIAEGKVAVFIVAGGQGSRLGFDGPKGCFPITPVKRKSIFEVLAQKVLAASRKHGAPIELYIMTSDTNHEETVRFFEDHEHFGLDADRVVFFRQRMLPAVDEKGRILLKNKDSLALAPGGTGGVYSALHNADIPRRMAQRGVEYLHYVHVDNPLAVIPDPAFVGQHIADKAEMSCKVVEKAYPEERVGVYVVKDGNVRNVEYIFMLEELLYRKDDDGKLSYRAGNIGNHIIDREFITRIATDAELPHFMAHKKISHLTKEGQRITPMAPNAFKFESFVFDALEFASDVSIFSVPREDEFAPVKNPEGRDSPDSARNMLTAQAKRWLEAAGIEKDVIDRLVAVEISPLFALTQEEFVEKARPHRRDISKRLQGRRKAYLN